MRTDSVKLRPGDRLEEGDQIYVASAQVWHTVKKGDTECGMIVGTNSNCRRPVSRPVTNPITNDAAGEWQEEVKQSCLTPEEELIQTSEYLQRALKENMDLHNRLRDMRELVDSLQKQLAALEEKLKAQEKNSSDVIEAARLLRIKLKGERDDLRQEVLNLQHSLAVERQRLESLDVGSAEQPETEVEKLAREIYVRNGTYSAKDSFQYAEEFIAERNRRRKESSK